MKKPQAVTLATLDVSEDVAVPRVLRPRIEMLKLIPCHEVAELFGVSEEQ